MIFAVKPKCARPVPGAAGEFFPQNADDFMKVAWAMGTPQNAWLRQVSGYWSIVTSFVNAGILNEELSCSPASAANCS